MENITFDLEVLGNTEHSFEVPIVQIAAVKFDVDGIILDKFNRHVDLDRLNNYKFVADYRTINWWLNQKPEAIQSVFKEGIHRMDLRQALHEFLEWIGELGSYHYWSHSIFDQPVIKSNYRIVTGKVLPIPRRLFLDIRTLSSLSDGGWKDEIKHKGIEHDALDDCIYQAEYISTLLKRLKNGNEV